QAKTEAQTDASAKAEQKKKIGYLGRLMQRAKEKSRPKKKDKEEPKFLVDIPARARRQAHVETVINGLFASEVARGADQEHVKIGGEKIKPLLQPGSLDEHGN